MPQPCANKQFFILRDMLGPNGGINKIPYLSGLKNKQP
jgi:hypothetical protein